MHHNDLHVTPKRELARVAPTGPPRMEAISPSTRGELLNMGFDLDEQSGRALELETWMVDTERRLDRLRSALTRLERRYME